MAEPCVFIVYREGGLEASALAAARDQWPAVQLRLTTVRDIYAYADTLRMLWSYPADMIVIEQDVVAPPGAIGGLFRCPQPWCTHPGWTGNRFHDDTLQLAKFSWEWRRRHPEIADAALARDDSRIWVRRGWTNLPPDTNAATMNRYGRRACLRPDAVVAQGLVGPGRRASTTNWVVCDTALAREIRAAGFRPHVHEPPTEHLHDYVARPVNVAEE